MREHPDETADPEVNSAFHRPTSMRKPVIAAVNGAAYAAGFILVLSCDLRVLAPHAVLCASGARLGLLPIGGRLSRLPFLMPPGKALELLLTAGPMSAREALDIGFANRIAQAGEVLEEVLAMARVIAGNSPTIVERIKQDALGRARWIRGAGLLLLLALLPASPALAIDLEVGQWIELKATHRQGVPLHQQPRPSLMGRAPDIARAEVLAMEQAQHWIQIRLEDGRAAWIIENYVGRVVEAPSPPSGATGNDEWLVWGSGAGCRQVVGAGRRMAVLQASLVRMGTWNIRWFPDETDLDWLACTIAWMNLDILAVVEIRDTPEARAAMGRVRDTLRTVSGATWGIDLHRCGPARSQHVGFLWRADRVTLSEFADRWHFNARATAESSPCAKGLRPGRYAYVKATGDGVDFHAIVVHLKSGSTPAARQERMTVVNRLDEAVADLLARDRDIVILGDFDTMGTGSPGSAGEELQTMATIATMKAPGFTRLTVEPPCTEYYRGHGEERECQLRESNERHGYKEGSPLANALREVFGAVGEQQLSFYMGVLSGPPNALERVKERAGIDRAKVSPLTYVDRHRTVHVPFAEALELAKAFCAAEPGTVLVPPWAAGPRIG